MPIARMTALAVLAAAGAASAQERVVFATNWLAQGEHGGFYQALADGSYAACGLEVEIVPGGPQVNNRALLMAGKVDFYMGGNMLAAFNAVAQGVPSRAVAAIFQKDPQAILAHPGKAERWEDLKGLTLMISDTGFASFYQWMMAAWGFTAEQRVPYTFNAAPFLVDPEMAMQGYATSEPFAIETEGGFVPDVFLLADHGYGDYSTTIEAMEQTIATRPQTVACFVDASIRGWYGYLYGDRAAADALILAANPDMSQERIDYSVARMKEAGIVDSGDARELGIGALTEARVGAFYRAMVEAGVVADGLDWHKAFTTDFVNTGVGRELRPAD